MFVKEITEIKTQLDELKSKGIIDEWELPYENLLTRRSAAIFFVESSNESFEEKLWIHLTKIKGFKYSINEDKKLSQLKYKVTFIE